MIGIYAENSGGVFKKSVLEAASCANQIGNSEITAITIGKVNDEQVQTIAKYGVSKLIFIEGISSFDAQIYCEAIGNVLTEQQIDTFIIPNTYEGKAISPRIAQRLGASFATSVIEIPNTANGFVVKRSVFSGKGFAFVDLTSAKKVITLTPNSIALNEKSANIQTQDVSFTPTSASKIEITGSNKISGKIPLTEAEIVVSGGRGMKGPENWGLIETLANELGAATACSKPVSDMDWRPHNEHVGQTGITIKPNLYIAIGISGAIQHLAGVSSSKIIVAINKDPEAPFFKAADYGIVGDAFEVLPQLIEAVKVSKN